METLKNYLESMFMNLPNTMEVRKAKDELWQMMEDKYAELIADGMSENEVVGTIISEFGNLDELADELGIEAVVRPREYGPESEGSNQANPSGDNPIYMERRMIGLDEAKDYLRDCASSAFCIALGVMLCIFSVIGPIVMDALEMNEIFGVVAMFVLIAIAVIIFVANGIRMQQWEYLKKEPCSIDFATSGMVNERKSHYRGIYTLLVTIGITLCIISFIPATILDEMRPIPGIMHQSDLGAVALFVLVGIGVFMIVLGSCTQGGFKRLLSLNNSATMAGNFEVKSEDEYNSPVVATIMSVYWPTVTCIYLCWSFLSFEWWRTWIIWPIAAILTAVIDGIWKK